MFVYSCYHSVMMYLLHGINKLNWTEMKYQYDFLTKCSTKVTVFALYNYYSKTAFVSFARLWSASVVYPKLGDRTVTGWIWEGRFFLSSRLAGHDPGCILAPALFCVAIDRILEHTTYNQGISAGKFSFTDLVYAHDTTAAASTTSVTSFSRTDPSLGLRVSWPKAKLQLATALNHLLHCV